MYMLCSLLVESSLCVCCFFFFKQKTAYEMRISDWSADVCSSDLFWGTLDMRSSRARQPQLPAWLHVAAKQQTTTARTRLLQIRQWRRRRRLSMRNRQIGRASCRERVCQYV